MQAAKEPSAFGQSGKEIAIVVFEPVVEGAPADALDSVENADGDDFAPGEDRLGMLAQSGQGVVYFTA